MSVAIKVVNKLNPMAWITCGCWRSATRFRGLVRKNKAASGRMIKASSGKLKR
jgi:hypothetical protein